MKGCVEESQNWIRLHLRIDGILESVSHIEPTLDVIILEISDDVALDDINQSVRLCPSRWGLSLQTL